MVIPCYDCGDDVVVDDEAEVAIMLCDICSIDYEYVVVPDLDYYN